MVGDERSLKDASVAAYSAAADHFDAPALSFWARYGTRTVQRIGLRPGERVLDACCGTGASALPAGQLVGPGGHVLGIDISSPALTLARAKAAAAGLSQVEFRVGDIGHTDLPSGSYDAVVCVFGIFFLPDMASALAELWRLVRPGGQLAVTIWGPRWAEPGAGAFWAAVERERPDLVRGFQPWTRMTDPVELAALFAQVGAATPVVVAEPGTQRLNGPEDWWTIVLGSGLRATIEALGPEAAQRVRLANLESLRGVHEVETNVVYAVARKPALAG